MLGLVAANTGVDRSGSVEGECLQAVFRVQGRHFVHAHSSDGSSLAQSAFMFVKNILRPPANIDKHEAANILCICTSHPPSILGGSLIFGSRRQELGKKCIKCCRQYLRSLKI